MDLNDLFKPLEQTIAAIVGNSKKQLEKISRNALNLNLESIVNTDQSVDSVIFDFVKYIDTHELVKKFIRNVICENNHTFLHEFVINNIDFLLAYRQDELSTQKILIHKNNFSKNSNFDSILKAFDEVLRQLENTQKVVFTNAIKIELNFVKNINIPKEVRLFILLEILISDYPYLSNNNEESTLDKLDVYLNGSIYVQTIDKEQRAYLQIIFRPSSLAGQVILLAYLSFESIYNNGQTKLDMIPIKYEQSKSTMENSSIKFSKEYVMEPILKFINKSLEEIDRRQNLGCQISDPLMIEFFLPFDYLFKKIDRWTSPFGIGTRPIPLGNRYKIIFRSFNRLLEPEYRVSLRRKWLTENLSYDSFACVSEQVIPQFHMFNDKAGIACFLHKSKSFREDIVSIALVKGISIVMWFEPNQKTICHLCDDPNRCSNYLIQGRSLILEGEREFQQCILARLIQASQGHSLNDLHAIYDSIEEIKNQVGSEGYFAILYDEPNRLSELASLFKGTKDKTLLGVSV